MKHWEVIIPPHGGGELCTLTIEAATWMMALSEGLRQLSDPADISSLRCTITPHGSLEIVDSRGRRTFTIRELEPSKVEPALTPSDGDVANQAKTTANPPPASPSAKRRTAEMVAHASDFFDKKPPTPSPPNQAMESSQVTTGETVLSSRAVERKMTEPAIIIDPDLVAEIDRLSDDDAKQAQVVPRNTIEHSVASSMRSPATEHDLAAVALDRMSALTYLTDRDNALAFSLDTALKLIPSEAGAILIYDAVPRELYLAMARGPTQPNPLGFRVPVHEGLAGFCSMNGLPLALSHVDQDQRFHTALSGHFGISVRSIMGAPIQHEERFYGVLELVNRQPDGPFLAEEVNALACIAWQLAQRLATALAV